MIVSVIICTRNRGEDLRKTLEALQEVVIPPSLSTEVIVVDNGSSDGTRGIVEAFRPARFQRRYIFESERGQVAARHAGIAAATGQVIVFTDDDVRPEAEWLREITRPILDGTFDAMAGTVRIAPPLLRPWMTSLHRGWFSSTENLDPRNPQGMVGANMAFSRRVLERVPGFDPELGPGRLGFWDDSLFSFQLKRANYRIGMATKSVVEHHFDPARLTRQSLLKRAEGEGRAKAYVAWHWEHLESPNPVLRLRHQQLKLAALRFLRMHECGSVEGCPAWEAGLLHDIWFYQYYASLRNTPRVYAKLGLRKLNLAELAQAA